MTRKFFYIYNLKEEYPHFFERYTHHKHYKYPVSKNKVKYN